MNPKRNRLFTLPFTLIASVGLLASGCAEPASPDNDAISASAPEVTPLGTGRFAANADATGASEGEEVVVEESCEPSDAGGWDCVWDDGETACTYGVDADGVLTYQDCSGSWGDYSCANTGAEIVCEWVSDRGSCTDTYSLDYELIESDCAPDQYYPEEDCTTQGDGTTLCTWDDGYSRCEMVYGADGEFVSQSCTDGYWSYDCLAADQLISCDLLVEGELLCSDTYDVYGNPIEMGCDEYYEEPTDPEEPYEECTEQDDGSWICIYDDGYSYCEVAYDAAGYFVSQACTDGYWSYNCQAAEQLISCELLIEGEWMCADTYDEMGEPIELGCDEYFGEPEEPVSEECVPQDDGSTLCSYDDGYWVCTSSYDAAGLLISSDCDTTDGDMSYDCATDPTDGLIYCEQRIGDETCAEVFTQEGEYVSTTCAYEGGDR